MDIPQLRDRCRDHLNRLCVETAERCVGSEGNRQATAYFSSTLQGFGWRTTALEFTALDWEDGGAALEIGGREVDVFVSPYSLPFEGTARLASAATLSELEDGDLRDTILLLHGSLAEEQLMPKNFVFYNPERHRRIVAALEASGARALLCATGRNAALAGGVYPFPLIEDGDFDIPSVYMTEDEGATLLPLVGEEATLTVRSRRIPGKGYNVTGWMGDEGGKRVVVTAHIDAKKGTPGATDNATGVTVLLALAELLQDYDGDRRVELVALNGEDHYAAPGQMAYIAENADHFGNVLVNVNIDGAGYEEGRTTFSFFDLPDGIHQAAVDAIQDRPGIKEGVQWPQGDHSIFLQHGIPALAVSSEWFTEHGESQDITHTPKDNLGIVDVDRVVEIARVLDPVIRQI